jgi:carboxymethylenebutenolidase
LIEQDIEIETAAGSMNTFVTHPEEGGPHPVVLFYMDAPGKRGELHDMARRIASVGYFVVLPNLYYRQTRDFRLVRDEAGMARMFELMRALSIEMVMQDTEAMLSYVKRQPAADFSRMGAVGYCMSGPFVIAAAARFPDQFKCVASIYGANLVTDKPDSPHLHLSPIKADVYLACAETDKWAPPEVIATLEKHLKEAHTRYRLEWYPGAEHGFAFPKREGIYHRPSAERHWERLFAQFRAHLS